MKTVKRSVGPIVILMLILSLSGCRDSTDKKETTDEGTNAPTEPRSEEIAQQPHRSDGLGTQVGAKATTSTQVQSTVPTAFRGEWTQDSNDAAGTNKIVISSDRIVFQTTEAASYTIGTEALTVSDDNSKLTFMLRVVVARGSFFPSGEVGLKRTVTLTRDGDSLLAELSAAKEKMDGSGLVVPQGRIRITRGSEDGKAVTYVQYLAEAYKYKRTK